VIGVKKKAWIFVIIGGITTIVALVTPMACFIYRSASFDTNFYLWMINLFFSYRYESGIHTTRIEFDLQLISFIPSLICSSIIMVLSIITIITANNYRKQEKIPKVSWLYLALGVIIATLIWMIMMEVSRWVLYGHTFWGLFNPGFGVIGLFIGAGFEIIGFMFLKHNQR
jgi:hypothetical protein